MNLPDNLPFIEQVIEILGKSPLDFSGQFNTNNIWQLSFAPRPLPAAVPLILDYQRDREEYVFRLIKRSKLVTQPGDLACPGGILHPFLDYLLMLIIRSGIIPLLKGKAGNYARKQGARTFNLIALFLATAMRESWEEIRLNPWKTTFLGALPSYYLQRFRRVIFPMVCFIKNPHRLTMNHEVEYMVDLPLDAFFHEENYGAWKTIEDGAANWIPGKSEVHPCLIVRNGEGKEDILWGATFHIITHFLAVTTDYRIPEWRNKRLIVKTMSPWYLSGAADRTVVSKR